MLFTPHLVYRDKSSSLKSINKPILKFQDVYIIPRSECSFRRIVLNGRSRNSIKAALLNARSEMSNPNIKITIVSEANGKFGGEWRYPKANSDTRRCLPESLARKGLKDGARIVSTLDGYEGQVYKDGHIIASRWWKERPNSQQWRSFCFSSDSAASFISMDSLEPQTVPFRSDIPIFAINREKIEHLLQPLNLFFVVGIMLACAVMYLTGQYGRHQISFRHTQDKVQSIEETAGAILSERRRALANMSYVQKRQEIGSDSLLLAALNDVSEVFAGTDFVISRVSYSTGDLELILQGEDDMSVPDVVARLEAMPTLNDVTISPNNKLLTIKSRIVAPRLKNSKT